MSRRRRVAAACTTRGSPSRVYRMIWATVQQIPRGRVATYGQIASAAGYTRQARQTGYALHALPADSGVPWHRVINAQGRISFPPRSAPYRRQRKKLEAEGVLFLRGRVNLQRYGWRAGGDSPLLD